MRERINTALKQAMKDRAKDRVATLRLVSAAIKDRDIAVRSEGNMDGIADADILAVLAKMVKQRLDSATIYDEAGRLELAEQERIEIGVIEDFLPKQLSENETYAAVQKAIADTGAGSIRDMGRVMGALKSAYAGQMDFGKAGGAVKELLG